MQNIEELRRELTAPIKSIRIFSIETALKSGNTPELLQCLQDCLVKEQDSECKILLEHAVSQVSAKLNTEKEAATPVEGFEAAYLAADAKGQLTLTNSLKIVQLKNLDVENMMPRLLSAAKDPVVAAELVKKFRKYWPQSQLTFLETNVFSKTKSLQIACIETLIKNFPESLKSQLLKLIFINDPVIRSLAIRGMAKHFPDLAAEFIKECFEKGDYYNKVTALKICSTIDFSLIKDSLLSLMFKDPEMKIFELGCTILLANPDKEMPFRLISFIQKTTPEKAEILKKIMGQYCKTIEIAGLCENFTAYMSFLNNYPKMLAAKNFINETLADYAESDEESKKTILSHISRHLDNQFVADALKNHIEKCSNDELKTALQNLISPAKTPAADPVATAAPVKEPEPDPRQSELSLVRELAKTRFNKTPEAAEKVKKILSASSEYSEAIVAAALKAAANLKLTEFGQLAKAQLKTKNEKMIIAALEYLALLNKEDFQQQIQKLLNTDLQLVRINLIRITGQEFPDYAVFLVKHMLESKDPAIRKNGLESAINVEFYHLVPMLTALLEKEDEPVLIENALALFLANPMIESVYNLKALEKKNSSHFMAFEKAGKELRKILQSTGIATEKEISAHFVRKDAEIQDKKAKIAKEKDYEQKLSDIKSALNWDSISGSIDDLKNLNWRRNLAILVGAFLLLNIVNYVFTGKNVPETKDQTLKPVLSKVTRYEAEVLKVFSKANVITVKTLDESGETLILTPPKGSSFVVKPGDRLSITGRPYKRNTEGQMLVEVSEILINSKK